MSLVVVDIEMVIGEVVEKKRYRKFVFVVWKVVGKEVNVE